jgi:hypothetical protein
MCRVIAPQFVAEPMGTAGVWWAVAGGWAIDLWLGEQTREHHDVEVAIRRDDQSVVHAALRADWNLYCLDPPGSGWRAWTGDPIEHPAFQLQARSPANEFDLFTETSDESMWRYRRDERIQLPLAKVWASSKSGLPIVRPEVQLLYMAKSIEPKHVHDFNVARPMLDDDARLWLAEALALAHPGHQWVRELWL